jgi:hypothetical protein
LALSRKPFYRHDRGVDVNPPPMPASPFAFVLLAALAALPAVAAEAPKGCTSAEHRQFDFWIGEWEVKLPNGRHAGSNRITSIHGGCALLEEWRGNGNVTGSSLNIYDRERGRWHQTWVDGSGGLLTLEGGLVDGAMRMTGETVEGGKRTLQRVQWTPQPDGRVRQHWEASEDGGQAWKTVFDGWYTRRP